jgi:hypothetical protein
VELTRTLYLKSFDRFNEILEYKLPKAEFAVVPQHDFTVLGVAPTFGTFTREGDHVAGVFASPKGPVFFLDKERVVCRFGCTSATVGMAPSGSMLQFTLTHAEPAQEKKEFTLRYQERMGIGTNPYDNEPEDIDLFAMLAAGLRKEQFFRNYTKDWV